MRNPFRMRGAALLIGGLTLALVIVPALESQTNADEALAKKYEKVLGKYEFDLTAMGGDARIIEVVVREGALWLDDGDGRPAEIKPVNGSEVEFAGQDAVNGRIQVFFIKDDSGAVVKFRTVLPDLDLDITGIKIK